MANLVGNNLGKYRVVARLGRGGMAEVYKAYQPGLDRYVGIKVLHAHLVDDPDFIGRFEREALAVAKLRHPNIVQAVDFDREGETYFMAMEFINGPTLKDEIKTRKAQDKPLTLPEVSRIFTALCSAIDYAHSRGMVHRDIKPANVMINDEGQVVLTDFGIARIMGATQYTQTGALSGTPAYMSPEQGQGERGDERSDIYALGVMLYEMVTGMVPYDADTPFAVIMKHISEPLPPPTTVNPEIPEAVERVIFKAMSKDPDDRYQTAGELARALRDAISLSPDDNLRTTPLQTVASAPKVHQIEHETGPISTMRRTDRQGTGGGATTIAAADAGSTVAMQPAAKRGTPMLLLLLGGGAVVVVLIVVIGFLLVGSGGGQDPQATETAMAIAIEQTGAAEVEAAEAATAEAQQAQLAAEETAAAATEAAIAAPTQTMEAATAQAERIAATEVAQATRDAGLVQGLLATVQAATAEAQALALSTAESATAEAEAAIAAAEAATAEALANATPTPLPTDTPTPAPPTSTPLPTVPADTPTPAPPTDTPTPERPALSGKLAYSADPGTGQYDVYIVSMPDGERLGRIQGARQPNFRLDGVKLLINGQGGGFGENIFEASATGSVEKPVSGSPTDLYPFYKPDGTTLTYSNPQLAFGAQGYQSYLFVQCGLIPPGQDVDKCAAIADFGIIIPPGAIGDVIGSHPVWTGNDLLAYRGCNTWQGGGSCGMFIVGSWAVKRTSNGETPRKIVDGTSVTPTDTKGGKIAFHSRESGQWEAYVVNIDGSGVVNISNSPNSLDGLPTISPDGNWVAFASNRDGAWAVYVAPITGGEAQKLFDFPAANPWGSGDREWTNERMSWAP